MSHYYTPSGEPRHEVVQKTDPTKTRPTRVTDATGKWLPSTTTKIGILAKHGLEVFKKQEILKAAAIEWGRDQLIPHPESIDSAVAEELETIASQYAHSASNFGSLCHDAIAKAITANERPESQVVWQTVEATVAWLRENVKPLYVEEVVTTEEYGGQVDMIGEESQGISILDFKSRSWKPGRKAPVYDEDLWQMCSYLEAVRSPRSQSPIQFVNPTSLCTVVINTVEPSVPFIHRWTPEEISKGVCIWRLVNRLWHLKNPKYQAPTS